MSTARYYRATCGSLYRVIETAARTATKTSRAIAAITMQARRSTHAPEFSPAYPTHSAEVARLVAIGSFVEVPCP